VTERPGQAEDAHGGDDRADPDVPANPSWGGRARLALAGATFDEAGTEQRPEIPERQRAP
jgi:hypothetical protein